MRLSEVTVAGVRSPVREAGPADATEAVVFVHGNPGCGADWDALLTPTSAFARVVALDMPGFGGADKPTDFPYTVAGYAAHLQGALEQLGVERAHLVLHDFGGPWGLRWAIEHPEAYASTTLINTGVLVRHGWHALAKVWRTPMLGELFFALSTRRGSAAFMRKANPPTMPAAYIDHLYDLYDDPGTVRAVLALYRATPASEMAAGAPQLREHPRPTLVVWGAKDPFLKVALAERQREVFRDTRDVAILPESGHWPLADNPAGVVAAVLPFLREQVGAGAATTASRA